MHKKTAQAIAKTTSEVIGYGVLVTDERGIIIGCNDEKRVGTLHEPSLEVMRTGQPALTSKEEAARLEGVKPGYTAPIALSAQVVGTISIAAPPQRAERYGLLVRKQAEILLMEQTFLELKLRQQLAVRDLAESIMLYRPEDENTDILLLHGKELGIDLERCRIAVILELQDLRRRPEGQDAFRDMALNCIINFFSNPAHLIAPLRNRQIVLFLALPCNRHEGEMEESSARPFRTTWRRMVCSWKRVSESTPIPFLCWHNPRIWPGRRSPQAGRSGCGSARRARSEPRCCSPTFRRGASVSMSSGCCGAWRASRRS